MAKRGRRGGRLARAEIDGYKLPRLRTARDAKKALEIIANGVVAGRLTDKRATAAGGVVRTWLAAHDVELKERVLSEYRLIVEDLIAGRFVEARERYHKALAEGRIE